MSAKGFLIFCLFCWPVISRAQDKRGAYTLGTGLLLLQGKSLPLSWTDTLPVYHDSTLSRLWARLDVTQTDCPECMACAEPQTYHQGSFHPFSCGGGAGPAFVCTRAAASFYEIITDTAGTRAYIPAQYGRYLSWKQYILGQAKQGEYFRITRPSDNTVLYDKPYPLEALPEAGSGFTYGLSWPDIDAYRFYPVAVQGVWLQLKAVQGRDTKGYCWIIWRNDSRLYKWFAWRAD